MSDSIRSWSTNQIDFRAATNGGNIPAGSYFILKEDGSFFAAAVKISPRKSPNRYRFIYIENGEIRSLSDETFNEQRAVQEINVAIRSNPGSYVVRSASAIRPRTTAAYVTQNSGPGSTQLVDTTVPPTQRMGVKEAALLDTAEDASQRRKDAAKAIGSEQKAEKLDERRGRQRREAMEEPQSPPAEAEAEPKETTAEPVSEDEAVHAGKRDNPEPETASKRVAREPFKPEMKKTEGGKMVGVEPSKPVHFEKDKHPLGEYASLEGAQEPEAPASEDETEELARKERLAVVPGTNEEGVPETATENTTNTTLIAQNDLDGQVTENTIEASVQEIAGTEPSFVYKEAPTDTTEEETKADPGPTKVQVSTDADRLREAGAGREVVQAAVEDASNREVRDERVNQNTETAVREALLRRGGPSNRLAGGTLDGAHMTTEATTGSTEGGAIDHVVDGDVQDASKPGNEAVGSMPQGTSADLLQTDRNNPDRLHLLSGTTLTENGESRMDGPAAPDRVASSANAQATADVRRQNGADGEDNEFEGDIFFDARNEDEDPMAIEVIEESAPAARLIEELATPDRPPQPQPQPQSQPAEEAVTTKAETDDTGKKKKKNEKEGRRDQAQPMEEGEADDEDSEFQDTEMEPVSAARRRSARRTAAQNILDQAHGFTHPEPSAPPMSQMPFDPSAMPSAPSGDIRRKGRGRESGPKKPQQEAGMEVDVSNKTIRFLDMQDDEIREVVDEVMSRIANRGEFVIGGRTSTEMEDMQREFAKKAARAQLLLLAKRSNMQQLAPEPPKQMLGEMVGSVAGELAAKGKFGKMGIFTPSDAMAAVLGAQDSSDTVTFTQEERAKMLAELKPWWNEFRLTRTTLGIMEMEAMPTNVIKSSTGSVQTASRVREDMSQTEQHFFYFMFWALRAKLSSGGTVAWKDLFRYSAAMGYNRMTQAQVNWLISGNPEGTIDDASGTQFDEAVLSERARISNLHFRDVALQAVAGRAAIDVNEPGTIPPNRNTSPSAAPGRRADRYEIGPDGKLRRVVDYTDTLEESGRRETQGIPTSVSNIPDPRYTERGGQMVDNVRIITVRNPKYDPSKPTGPDNKEWLHTTDNALGKPPGDNPEFIEEAIPDVGAGAREIQGDIQKAEADRLISALPFKLYAPIHPQACDRYLGSKNYARLALEPPEYFKSFTQHPFGPDDIQQQYSWNSMIMAVYGPMLYAFVTDIAMQRSEPVFDMQSPEAVTLEYMELNELVAELKVYQMKSADRASRVGDSGAAQTPIEKHLDDFFKDRDQTEQEKLADANAVVISLPDVGPPPRPGGGDDDDDDDPGPPPQPPAPDVGPAYSTGFTVGGGMGQRSRDLVVPPMDITHGIRRNTQPEPDLKYKAGSAVYSSRNSLQPAADAPTAPDQDRRARMFKMMYRR